jgi:hypothetical protein
MLSTSTVLMALKVEQPREILRSNNKNRDAKLNVSKIKLKTGYNYIQKLYYTVFIWFIWLSLCLVS